MTQVAAAQGSLKLLFNGEAPAASAASFGSGPRDPFCCSELKSTSPLQKLRFGLYSSSPFSLSRSQLFNRLGTRYRAGSEGLLDEYDYDSEAEEDKLACFRGLVLDISYRPVNVVCWRRAICLEFMEKGAYIKRSYISYLQVLVNKFEDPPFPDFAVDLGSGRGLELRHLADVLEYYDQTVNSPSGSFYIPAVLRVTHLLQVVKRRRIVHNLNKKNILRRDKYTCQYCSSGDNLTIDHVLPVAQGGKWEWENLVTACSKCNSRKGQKTLEEANMKLIKVPRAPKDYDILAIPLTSAAIRMLRLTKGTPEEWRQYLSKSSSDP